MNERYTIIDYLQKVCQLHIWKLDEKKVKTF